MAQLGCNITGSAQAKGLARFVRLLKLEPDPKRMSSRQWMIRVDNHQATRKPKNLTRLRPALAEGDMQIDALGCQQWYSCTWVT